MDTVHTKIKKTSTLASRLLRIAGCLTASFAILLAVGIIILVTDSSLSLSLREAYATLPYDGAVKTPTVMRLGTLFAFGIVQLSIIYALLHHLYRFFSDISGSYTPFEQKQVVRIKKVAALTLLMCIVSSLFDVIGSLLLKGSISVRFNAIWLILALVIYAMAFIFDYGCQLQTQSDETL